MRNVTPYFAIFAIFAFISSFFVGFSYIRGGRGGPFYNLPLRSYQKSSTFDEEPEGPPFPARGPKSFPTIRSFPDSYPGPIAWTRDNNKSRYGGQKRIPDFENE